MRIEAASSRDLPGIQRLLQCVALPAEGAGERLATTLVAREDSRLIGTAAVEFYPDGALLRSVAVEPGKQGSGIGRELTEAALRLAREGGAGAVYLLTTTAQRFFPKFGFETITRDAVPETVKASDEFRGVCCASAVVMRKTLLP
ncbi:MAG TPA: arsenic resistance N-acetyltransferase ArsN2 [Candidatus Polarisedimenticolia bacterium]|nr:arsenic resistance N-acetyltransferase ArsN2 [Candidatus Polarisedimenticolia bacterium]